ncbi:DUF6881 domain-containing protein [Actinacidiphila sp. ITFR-21]|uniref:DUF6881 domain-containing protein n=1 Tax=Actinacidiphila sp. ITFR-21 TaxID=3075199 RepID=UPI002889D655|nr:hypothetical protein [Streptomyces sp. ITFR-21]WNI17688.1 hypothetical protein RLT57_20575 [Streptomyces sp. ITFR-21]WNI17828.1 hypothetical protein RLT57_21290 [Streptomyces sp. ITFR-21]
MTETTENDRVPFLPEVNPQFPLLYVVIAAHLGIYRFKERDRAENLRRVKKVFQTYGDLGIPLLTKNGGEPFTAEDITDEMIARHDGLVTGEQEWDVETFEDHLLNIVSNHTGVPRISYLRIIRQGPINLGRPSEIHQEVNDRHRSEVRRVEVYADGRHLWRQDGEFGEGTAEEEFTESETVWPLSVLNQRDGQSAETTTADEFERLWERATSEECGWPQKFKAEPVVTDLEDAEVVTCSRTKEEGSAFCAEHGEMARRVFPALFPTA